MDMEPSWHETSWRDTSTDDFEVREDETYAVVSSAGYRSDEPRSEFFLKLERGEILK
jgi:hypothetical protein